MSAGLVEILFGLLVVALIVAAGLILLGFWRATAAPVDREDEP